MLVPLIIICMLIWLPILLYLISERGFPVLLIWLLIAPVMTNLFHGQTNPFFTLPEDQITAEADHLSHTAFSTATSSISPDDLYEPTRVLLGLFLIIFLLDAFCQRKHLVPLDGTEIWMVIFSLILVASALLQSNRLAWAMHKALDAFIVPFLGYYTARRLVTSEYRFRRLILILGYLSFYIIICCLIERLIHTELTYRLHGPFHGPAKLQILLMVAFYAALLEPQALSYGIRRFILYLTPVIILLTWLRANWVGFLAGLWVLLFLGYRLSPTTQKLRNLGVGLMLIPLVVISVATFISQESESQEAVQGRVGDAGTVEWRLLRWSVAIQEGINHPFIGIGLTNLQDALGRSGLNYATAHSSFLTFFAEHGSVGLIVYLGIVTSIIRQGMRLYHMDANPQAQWRGIVLITVLVTHQFPSLFYDELHSYHLSHVYAYIFIGGIAGVKSMTKGT